MKLLQPNRLYLLSGPPATGKSTFLEKLNIPHEMVISSDSIRKQIFKPRPYYRDVFEHINISDSAESHVWAIVDEIAHARLSQHLTTFIDTTLVTDSDRGHFVKIAKRYGMRTTVLIMQTDERTALANNRYRKAFVPEHRITEMFANMQYKSKHDYALIDPNEEYMLDTNHIDSLEIDVIGDVHGLYDELVDFLQNYGYYVENNQFKHVDDRKLLFLGDVVDRGPKSVETLTIIANSVIRGGHYMIRGNHDNKIWKHFDRLKNGSSGLKLSSANAETVGAMMRLKQTERDYLLSFLGNLPHYQTCVVGGMDYAFTHADLIHFDPHTITLEDAVYGCAGYGRVDSDALYDVNKMWGNNRHILLRGHIGPTNKDVDNVLVLEMGQAFAGKLAMCPLDELDARLSLDPELSPKDAFQSVVKTYQCTYNYRDVMGQRTLFNSLYELVAKRLVTAQVGEYGLKIYKYSKRVFWDNLWDESTALLKARGLVLDSCGEIIQHPFDKVFNYLIERDAGKNIPDDEIVILPEKLNGFLGCVTRHPYKNDLLITTSGSFDSKFVGYIKDYIDGKRRGLMMRLLHEQNMTLMFEVLHPDDPHIIEYTADDYGLYLIGARGKLETDVVESEEMLDELAKAIDVRRPDWHTVTMAEARDMLTNAQIEGYMVRNAATGEYICKMKSPLYLSTKMLGRLSKNNIYMMFNAPDKFKQRLDEEFWFVVDLLREHSSIEEMLEMDKIEKTEFVRLLINEFYGK